MRRKGRIRYERASNGWLTTFSDLMTLLLTFFVLLITMASLEGGKIRTMVSELNSAMGVLGSPQHKEFPVFTPITRVFLHGKKYKEVQHLYRDKEPRTGEESNHIAKPLNGATEQEKAGTEGEENVEGKGIAAFAGEEGESQRSDDSAKNRPDQQQRKLPDIADKALKTDVESLAADTQGLTFRTDNEQNLILGLPDKVLFEPGKADIRPGVVPVLKSVAQMIARNPDYSVIVLGHTDDQPIHNPQFPSNWELSVARASSVLKFVLKESGSQPSRFMASGYGPSLPVAPNGTPESRSLNRRVEIKLVSKK